MYPNYSLSKVRGSFITHMNEPFLHPRCQSEKWTWANDEGSEARKKEEAHVEITANFSGGHRASQSQPECAVLRQFPLSVTFYLQHRRVLFLSCCCLSSPVAVQIKQPNSQHYTWDLGWYWYEWPLTWVSWIDLSKIYSICLWGEKEKGQRQRQDFSCTWVKRWRVWNWRRCGLNLSVGGAARNLNVWF